MEQSSSTVTSQPWKLLILSTLCLPDLKRCRQWTMMLMIVSASPPPPPRPKMRLQRRRQTKRRSSRGIKARRGHATATATTTLPECQSPNSIRDNKVCKTQQWHVPRAKWHACNDSNHHRSNNNNNNSSSNNDEIPSIPAVPMATTRQQPL